MLIEVLLLAGSLARLPPEAVLHLYVEDATYADAEAERLLHETYPVASLRAEADGTSHDAGSGERFTVEFPVERLDVSPTPETYLLLRGHLSASGDTAFETGDYLSKQAYPIDLPVRASDVIAIELSVI